ncbi:Germinal-center associated nuclear protein [Dictyocoela muelleri]|nr:Germinal-center associated nuclear protein [Dictyocoela muelleri]
MKLESQYEKLKQDRLKRPEITGSIKGECLDFCPEFEKIERKLRNDINFFESKVLVKKYQRSSAGKQRSLVEDVRPIEVLEKTFDHLLNLLKDYIKTMPDEIYRFVEDRCRAIRQDISIQSLDCDRTIELLLKICRFHIFFNHYLYNSPSFDIHLNKDQIRRILITLMDIHENRKLKSEKLFNLYSILEKNNKKLLNRIEEEYIAYYILSNLSDNDVYYKMIKYSSKSYPHENTKNFLVELALKMMIAYQRNDWIAFFNILKNAPFLFSAACLSFIDIQRKSIICMKQCFYEKISLDWISSLIMCDVDYTKALILREGVAIEGDKINFKDKTAVPKEIVYRPQKIFYIENKRVDNVEFYIKHGDFIFYLEQTIIKLFLNHYLKFKFNKSSEVRIENEGRFKKAKDVDNTENILSTDKNEFIIQNNDLSIKRSKKCKLKNEINERSEPKTKIVEGRDVEPKFNERSGFCSIKNKIITEACNSIFNEKIYRIITTRIKRHIIDQKICELLNIWRKKVVEMKMNLIICVLDNSLFSAVLKKKMCASELSRYGIYFVKRDDIAMIDLLKYKLAIFCAPQNEIAALKTKYYMLNKFIDTPVNLIKLVENGTIQRKLSDLKFVRKLRLRQIIKNLEKSEAIAKMCEIIKSGKNSKETEAVLLRAIKDDKFDDCDVFVESNK